MAQPTPYEREFNFSNQQAATPSDPIPAPHLDAELNRVKLTTDEILANLALFQNDEGEVTIGYDQLDPEIIGDIVAAGADPGAFDLAFEAAVPDSAALAAEIAEASALVTGAGAATAGRGKILGFAVASPSVLVKGEGPVVANDWNLNPTRTAAQNRVALDAALAYMESEGGGELQVLGAGDTIPIEPISAIPANISIRGNHPNAVAFSFNESAGVDGFTFVAPASGTYLWSGLKGCSILNAGANKMGKAVSTPDSTPLFAAATHWEFERIQFRGGNWAEYMSLGDANQGSVRYIEWRGTYDARSNDSGQVDCIGIDVSAATGSIGWEFTGLMCVSVRRPMHFGDNTEGFALTNSEFVNCWIGLDRDPNPSKPGGFVDNVHINANYRAIRLARTRDFMVGKVLLYRDGSYYDHTGDWKAIEIDGSGGVAIARAIVRVPSGFVNDTGMTAIDIDSTSQVDIGEIIVREAGGLDTVLKLVNTDTIKVGGLVVNEVPVWADIDTLSQNINIGPVVAYGAKPATSPWVIAAGMTGAKKRTIKINRLSAFQNYNDRGAISAAATAILRPGFDAMANRWQMSAGGGAYTYNIDLDIDSAVDGDRFDLRFHFDNTVNPTVVIRNGSGGSTILSLNNATGAIWRPKTILVYNGSGWQLDDYHLSLG